MKTIILPLVVDENGVPLPKEKQLAISLVRGTGKGYRAKVIDIVGWPFLAYRIQDGGYVVFDETAQISTEVQLNILQDYDRILSVLDSLKEEKDILDYINSVNWGESKGFSSINLKGIVSQNMKDVFKYGASDIPLRVLDRKLKDVEVRLLLSDWEGTKEKVKANLAMIDRVLERIVTTLTIWKGKRAEEKKQIQEEYDKRIAEAKDRLEKEVVEVKKEVEGEVKSLSSQLYSKMADIEVLLAKAEIDYIAGHVPNINSVASIKANYLNEISGKLDEVKAKYKQKIFSIVNEIESLNQAKQKALAEIDAKIKTIEEAEQRVRAQFNELKNREMATMEKLSSLSQYLSTVEEVVEFVVPFMIIDNSYLSIQTYKGVKKSLFGFLKKDPSEISTPINVNIRPNVTPVDTLRNYKDLVEDGLRQLYEEGWNVRRNLSDYYQ
ncbi:MAG: hypothetical protein TQ35_0007710 [Candidatus Aramenus sulfurataquae]|jgi:F0F1-type ATP synthase membrane subunit b/b'|uniref:Uncharacterized protein n=2 Tax=Candidatus Aramenus sulfurataquae TaxID=1326980 RepID=A0A0F2LM75_9CREN|nr:hypothetical protein [Candidatus Aramenus sulfurataquae]